MVPIVYSSLRLVKEVSIDSIANKKKSTSEVSIEDNKPGVSWKDANTTKVELPSEELESNVDQKKFKERSNHLQNDTTYFCFCFACFCFY